MPHAVLLFGQDLARVEAAAVTLASHWLRPSGGNRRLPEHPDAFTLRPTGKLRQIGAEPTRELIRKVQHSASLGDRKVALVHEADRMNRAAANIFLKTLEEPPAGTALFLLTSRPYALLPTIRSRCLGFRLPAPVQPLVDERWEVWIGAYRQWLGVLLGEKLSDRARIASVVMQAYGLITRFEPLVESLMKQEEATAEEADDKRSLDEGEKDALEAGRSRGLRRRLFAWIEQVTRDEVLGDLATGGKGDARNGGRGGPAAAFVGGDRDAPPGDDSGGGRMSGAGAALDPGERILRLNQVTGELERVTSLLEVNLNHQAALEHFLLRSLQIWAGRG